MHMGWEFDWRGLNYLVEVGCGAFLIAHGLWYLTVRPHPIPDDTPPFRQIGSITAIVGGVYFLAAAVSLH